MTNSHGGEIMKNIRFHLLREELAMTQEELANQIGISQSMVALIESGRRDPRRQLKIKIAKYFNVTVEWLFYEEINDQ
jgi:putative transcriptional regulator